MLTKRQRLPSWISARQEKLYKNADKLKVEEW
jgi:hypothetical protein